MPTGVWDFDFPSNYSLVFAVFVYHIYIWFIFFCFALHCSFCFAFCLRVMLLRMLRRRCDTP